MVADKVNHVLMPLVDVNVSCMVNARIEILFKYIPIYIDLLTMEVS